MLGTTGKEADQLKFTVNTIANATKGNVGKAGSILVSIEVVPKAFASSHPVGFGRSDPNQNPFLPGPTGRFEWTINPWKLYVSYCECRPSSLDPGSARDFVCTYATPS